MQPTPGLILEYQPLPGAARLIRVYGDTPCPVLPDEADGLPITELGPYCFAPTQRERLLPPAEALRRYTVPGGAPMPEAPRIGGSFLEQITLPAPLRVLGEAAFYNCRKLNAIALGTCISTIGSDVFTNTFALRRLNLCAGVDTPSGIAKVLGSLQGEVSVAFCPDGSAPQAVLRYPEYWEDVEETPAHILLHTFNGPGYHYRQLYQNGLPQFEEYDAILPQTGAGDAPAAMALLALERLRWPYALSDTAAAAYREFLRRPQHSLPAVKRLLAGQELPLLRFLLELGVLDAAALAEAAALAQAADNAEAAALVLQAQKALAPQKRRYDFDDF